MELFSSFKRVLLTFAFILIFLCFLLWLSLITYGAIYYSVIPAAAHIRPIYLQFPPSECSSQSLLQSLCVFPFGNVTLVHEGEYDLLRKGHTYAVEIALDMPESEANQKLGMFMIEMSMLSKNKDLIQYSSRPAILSYKSFIFKTIFTLFYSPWLLSGSIEEKQLLIIPLFEQYVEDSYRPTHFVHVTILAKSIQIYSCFLRIHAQFKGFRYFMYYWPLVSTILGVTAIFLFICGNVFIVLLWWMRTSELMNLPFQVRRREKKQKETTYRKFVRQREKASLKFDNVTSTTRITEPKEEESIVKNSNEKEAENEKEPLSDKGESDFDEELYSSSTEYIQEEESDLVKSLRQRRLRTN